MSRAHHTDIPFPHDGCCVECRALEICNCCGHPAPKATRCTNGHCANCHANVCTPGGITGPGHGFGTRSNREAAAHRRLHEGAGRINFDAWVHADDAEVMKHCAAALAHGRAIIDRLVSAPVRSPSPADTMFLQDLTVAKSALMRLGRKAGQS